MEGSSELTTNMKLFPTDGEYGQIYAKHPVPQLALVDEILYKQFSAHDSLTFGEVTLGEWFIHLANRMIHARKAYHLMLYFLELGIPDDRPWVSPGKCGASVEYFPDFEAQDYSKSAWFGFYADAFVYKLFSAWDSIGQLLAVVHGLSVPRPSFFTVATALKANGVPLGSQLLALWERDEFKRFRDLRHDATHNFLPGTFGGSITTKNESKEITLHDGERVKTTRTVSFGVGQYVKSKDVLSIANAALNVFDETLRAVALR
jgi:Cthe_2314-like HEPN